jgi:hypothetical protein
MASSAESMMAARRLSLARSAVSGRPARGHVARDLDDDRLVSPRGHGAGVPAGAAAGEHEEEAGVGLHAGAVGELVHELPLPPVGRAQHVHHARPVGPDRHRPERLGPRPAEHRVGREPVEALGRRRPLDDRARRVAGHQPHARRVEPLLGQRGRPRRPRASGGARGNRDLVGALGGQHAGRPVKNSARADG